jgi:hypothetical protein
LRHHDKNVGTPMNASITVAIRNTGNKATSRYFTG